MGLAFTGCATFQDGTDPVLHVPCLASSIEVDGKLNEDCYRQHAPLTSFVVAADNARQAPSTKAWLFWNEERLVCAFECVDSAPAPILFIFAGDKPLRNEKNAPQRY